MEPKPPTYKDFTTVEAATKLAAIINEQKILTRQRPPVGLKPGTPIKADMLRLLHQPEALNYAAEICGYHLVQFAEHERVDAVIAANLESIPLTVALVMRCGVPGLILREQRDKATGQLIEGAGNSLPGKKHVVVIQSFTRTSDEAFGPMITIEDYATDEYHVAGMLSLVSGQVEDIAKRLVDDNRRYRYALSLTDLVVHPENGFDLDTIIKEASEGKPQKLHAASFDIATRLKELQDAEH